MQLVKDKIGSRESFPRIERTDSRSTGLLRIFQTITCSTGHLLILLRGAKRVNLCDLKDPRVKTDKCSLVCIQSTK